MQQQIKPSHDLEAIYAPTSTPLQMPALNTNNKNTRDDPSIKLDIKPKRTSSSEFSGIRKDTVQPIDKDLIEVRTFLPTRLNKLISSRYENPLTQLKGSTKRWKAFTLILAIFSFVYFSLNLWVTVSMIDIEMSAKAPRALIQMSSVLIEMQDMMFYNHTVNLIMDIWALVIFIGLTIMLLGQSTADIEKSFDEKGRLERMLIRGLMAIVILFALSYIAGTVFLLKMAHKHMGARSLLSLIAYHVSKMVFLLLNVIAFKVYRAKKFVYEDLLLEAMEPSDIADEKSEVDDHNNLERHHYPIRV